MHSGKTKLIRTIAAEERRLERDAKRERRRRHMLSAPPTGTDVSPQPAAVVRASDRALDEALREAEDSLRQARADAWQAFDALAGSDLQAAVDLFLADVDERIDPLIDTVMKLGGDPWRC